VRKLVRLYDCRKALRSPLNDRRGGLILPAFPELLQRPPKRAKKGEEPPSPGPDFERRRTDAMEGVVRTFLAIVACTDWVSMEVLDPRGGYLSVARLAQLAELPDTRTERALRALRTAGLICFTQQHRERLDDGSYTSTGPALRKVPVGFFRKFGGYLLQLFDKRRKKLQDDRKKVAPTTGDLRVAALVRSVGRNHFASAAAQREQLLRLEEAVQAEHPDWAFPEILSEARRRLERGPPPEHPPPPAAPPCPF